MLSRHSVRTYQGNELTRNSSGNKKEWENSVGLCQKRKQQHPHHEKGSPRGQWGRDETAGEAERSFNHGLLNTR